MSKRHAGDSSHEAPAPSKRFCSAAGDAHQETEQSKRFRSAIDRTADEFLCPITQDLPMDPVTAEDGSVYERSAITQWLAKQQCSMSVAAVAPVQTGGATNQAATLKVRFQPHGQQPIVESKVDTATGRRCHNCRQKPS